MEATKEPFIEVCVDNFEMASAALKNGAHSIELCAALESGGITPSGSLLRKVCRELKMQVHVMVRPRAGDFLYSDTEFELLKEDIIDAKNAGATGIVFGILRGDGSIDRERCMEVAKLASPLNLTFHRAFDMTHDPFLAMEEIIGIGFNRLLTSGQRQSAEDGLEMIRELVKRAARRITVMAGSGINADNLVLLHEAGVNAFHFTSVKKSSSLMKHRNEELQSLSNRERLNEYEQFVFDAAKFNRIKKALQIS